MLKFMEFSQVVHHLYEPENPHKMSASAKFLSVLLLLVISPYCLSQSNLVSDRSLPFELYPVLNESRPSIPSPWIHEDGNEYVLAVNREAKYAVIKVTLSNHLGIGRSF